ncbi:hypothetical protein V8B97DRAFT_2011733 [Scleroderma yunnanense]
MLTYGCRWTEHVAITYQQKDQINKLLGKLGLKPGTTKLIEKYQAAVGKVIKQMSAEELAAARETAEKWNKTCPPPEVQSHHDYNDEITNDQLFNGWGYIEDRWCWYAKDMFGSGEDWQPKDSEDEAPARKKVQKGWKKPKHQLSMGLDGNSQIPAILNMAGRERKALMHAFVAFHYRIAHGQENATVPWGAIGDNVVTYISKEYFPPNVRFKELTKLTVEETTKILEWWQEHQEENPNNISAGNPQSKATGKRKAEVDKVYDDPKYTDGDMEIYNSKEDFDN